LFARSLSPEAQFRRGEMAMNERSEPNDPVTTPETAPNQREVATVMLTQAELDARMAAARKDGRTS